jgi:hypothetical protein
VDRTSLPIYQSTIKEKKEKEPNMKTDTFRGRDFITLLDWSKEEVEQILDLALDLKRDRAIGQYHDHLLRARPCS